MKLKSVRTFIVGLMFVASAWANDQITVGEVIAAQESWGKGIVRIGKEYINGGDYEAAAAKHIRDHYDYEEGTVLFKPTLASVNPFRPTFNEALSYFVGGMYPEDSGFAIKPWTHVRFDNHSVVVYGSKGIAMGHYYFKPVSGNEIKVEYTLGFKKRNGEIRIFLQDSSLPFDPTN